MVRVGAWGRLQNLPASGLMIGRVGIAVSPWAPNFLDPPKACVYNCQASCRVCTYNLPAEAGSFFFAVTDFAFSLSTLGDPGAIPIYRWNHCRHKTRGEHSRSHWGAN